MCTCLQSKIGFNSATIERIFTEPNVVLRDVKSFWQNETPYRRAMEWAPPTYPICFEEFQRLVRACATIFEGTEEKTGLPLLKYDLRSGSQSQREGLALICSYLPPDTFFETIIHLASYIFLSGPETKEPKYAPNAFVAEPDIIVNLSSKFWTHDVDEALNLLTHEIYHIGFNTRAATFRPNHCMHVRSFSENVIFSSFLCFRFFLASKVR